MRYKLVLTNGQEYELDEETSRKQMLSMRGNQARTFVPIKGVGMIPLTSVFGWLEMPDTDDGDKDTRGNITRNVKNRNCCASPKIELRKGKNKRGETFYAEQCVSCCKRGVQQPAPKGSATILDFILSPDEYKQKMAEK